MFVEDLYRGVSTGNQTDLVMLDFSKVFDKVSNSKLLWKLHQYGIIGKALSCRPLHELFNLLARLDKDLV